MPLVWPGKDPDEVLDYATDWAPRLEDGDYIVTPTWIVPDEIASLGESKTNTKTTIWLTAS